MYNVHVYLLFVCERLIIAMKHKVMMHCFLWQHNDENWKIDLPLLSALGQNKDRSLEGHQEEGVEEEEEEESGSIQERVVSLNSEVCDHKCTHVHTHVAVCVHVYHFVTTCDCMYHI